MTTAVKHIDRPKTAPIKHVTFQEEKSSVERCIICMKKIFSGAFAQISDENNKRDPICSVTCFNKYTKNSMKELPVLPIPIAPTANIGAINREIKHLAK